jgi:hypothetical protein
MADESPVDSPHQLLRSVRDLTRQVRIAQRGTWFPLLVFAVITLAAIPVVRYGPHHPGPCRSDQTGTGCSVVSPWWSAYWPIALVLAYVAIAGFYLYQSRRRGVGSRIRPYVVVGVVVAVLLVAASLWLAQHPPAPATAGAPLTQLVDRLATPMAAIGLALLVLAWVERNPALLGFSLVYLLIVLVPGSFLPVNLDRVRTGSPWYFLPLLIPAAVLLLGSLGFAVIRPATRRHPR